MEYFNKEEADKAMERAEAKFISNDLEGAKRMALKAQRLCPSLHGLKQMLAAFEVHIAAATKKKKGRINWYAVLGIDPSSDIESIKKQYKKLSLLTHPDKNTSAAADGAFKLVVEAWEAISGEASNQGGEGKEEDSSTNKHKSRQSRRDSESSSTRHRSKEEYSSTDNDSESSSTWHRSKEHKSRQSRRDPESSSSRHRSEEHEHKSRQSRRSSSRHRYEEHKSRQSRRDPEPSSTRHRSKEEDSSTNKHESRQSRRDRESSWTRHRSKGSSRTKIVCSYCHNQVQSLDSRGLVIGCEDCNWFSVKASEDNYSEIIIQGSCINGYDGSAVTVKVHGSKEVDIYIDQCEEVDVHIDRCNGFRIGGGCNADSE